MWTEPQERWRLPARVPTLCGAARLVPPLAIATFYDTIMKLQYRNGGGYFLLALFFLSPLAIAVASWLHRPRQKPPSQPTPGTAKPAPKSTSVRLGIGGIAEVQSPDSEHAHPLETASDQGLYRSR